MSLISTYTYYVKLDDMISSILAQPDNTDKEELTDQDLGENLTVTLKTTYGSGTTLTTTSKPMKMRQYRLFDLS